MSLNKKLVLTNRHTHKVLYPPSTWARVIKACIHYTQVPETSFDLLFLEQITQLEFHKLLQCMQAFSYMYLTCVFMCSHAVLMHVHYLFLDVLANHCQLCNLPDEPS